MNILKDCLTSWMHLQVLEALVNQSGGMSQRQLSQIIGLPNSTLQRILSSLGETGIIKPSSMGKATYWSLDKESYLYDTLRPLIDALNRITPPFQYLRRMIQKTLGLPDGYRCFIFGSIADKTDTSASDIDLAIVLPPKVTRLPQKISTRLETLQDLCRYRFGKLLNPLVIPGKKLTASKPSPIVLNVMKGLEI